AYPVRGLDIADRPLDFFVPDFLALVLAEPPHRHALNICKHNWPWLRAALSAEYRPYSIGNIFPGLKMFCGSSACFSARMASIASGPSSASRYFCLPCPMPCSPVQVP